MGLPMAGHLQKAGHELCVFSRARKKAEPLLERGAIWRNGPAAVATGADVVCTMVGTPSDVRDIYFGADGIMASARQGALLVDFTTSSPSLAIELAQAAANRGCQALDAPVSGGDVGARNATLSIMAGGEQEAFEKAMPVFQCLGKTITRQGPAGAGQHAKIVNQIMIASNMVGMCEGLLYARHSGLDPCVVLKSVEIGAASSWCLSNLYPRILKGDYAPGFYVEHFIKDLKIALDEAEKLNLSLPGLALATKLYEAVQACGHGRSGTQSLIFALEQQR